MSTANRRGRRLRGRHRGGYYLAVRRGVSGVVIVGERPPLSPTSDKSTECYRNWWPGPDLGHLEEVRLRAEREEQMIELELTPDIAKSRHARNLSGAQVEFGGSIKDCGVAVDTIAR